jgi:DNA-directed RNA polymerase subunit alpha
LDNEHGHLVMELVVSTGRGFVSADTQATSTLETPPIGVILIDAIYSPVVKAHFRIESLYQGRRDQTACIHLEITTDGTITPDEALRQSAAILERQFGVFAQYRHQDEAEVWKRSTSSEVAIPPHLYEASIDDLQLSARAYNCLKRAGITKIGLLLEMDKMDLLGIRNVGEKVIQELTERLYTHGFFPETTMGERITV